MKIVLSLVFLASSWVSVFILNTSYNNYNLFVESGDTTKLEIAIYYALRAIFGLMLAIIAVLLYGAVSPKPQQHVTEDEETVIE